MRPFRRVVLEANRSSLIFRVELMTADYVVIGGGVIGLSVARELKRRFPGARVVVLEKELRCGAHASTRNSGVLHAGFYYTADSLKARFTRDGNRRLTEFCEERGLAIRKCGKLVVAKNESELEGLDELLRRARVNGVQLEPVTEDEAKKIEPRVRTCGRALFSPTTSTVNPSEVLGALEREVIDAGIELRLGEGFAGWRNGVVTTEKDSIECGYVVNSAGLHADSVAQQFGFSQHYRILPFKGLYLYSSEPPGAFQTHIYPVPDLKQPFLGVHFTVTVDGRAKIGPTAIPAFWREHYGGFKNFKLWEMADICLRQLSLALHADFDFRRLALEEMKKQYAPYMVRQAARMARGVRPGQYKTWGAPGIRAQLVDLRGPSLVMDFLLEGDARSLHILNAVSPGFTCAFPFAEHVCDRIDQYRGESNS
ncbi:putative L-2-hydroxyglutarate oxidase [Nitrospina gracilis 3/211]|uniref:Putative L-2-hydroxyglutarate oxidase n=1 Tax=Nitrospina gracilis (strain 3/211) TaxID=1266370 RepID=M1YWU7_NITG3|nr:putative L-2-hydroxyglutarate oxidase [Nitrospina gracilis 3/211]